MFGWDHFGANKKGRVKKKWKKIDGWVIWLGREGEGKMVGPDIFSLGSPKLKAMFGFVDTPFYNLHLTSHGG